MFGEDLDLIDSKAREIARVMSAIAGAEDVQVKSPPGAPRMAARLRPERLAQFGFRPLEVLEAIQTAYQGAVVAQTYEGNKVFDVTVVLEPSSRQEPEGIGALMIRNTQGLRMPLRELADVYPTNGRYAILHEGARRRQSVTCNPAGRGRVLPGSQQASPRPPGGTRTRLAAPCAGACCAAPTATNHFLADCLRHQEATGDIGVEDVAPFVERHRLDRLSPTDACIIDEHIDAVKSGDDSRYGSSHLIGFRDVAHLHEALDSQTAQH